MSKAQKTSEVASAAPLAVLRRSIQMKMFLPEQKAGQPTPHIAVAASMQPLPLGQIVGIIYAVQEREGELPDGSKKTSLLAVGEFEGTNYDTGEVFESTGCYLPDYYLQTVKAAFEGNAKVERVTFAVEVSLHPTGKPIPTTYMLTNLVRRRADNPLNQLKLELADSGRLKGLPAPIALQEVPAIAALGVADHHPDAFIPAEENELPV